MVTRYINIVTTRGSGQAGDNGGGATGQAFGSQAGRPSSGRFIDLFTGHIIEKLGTDDKQDFQKETFVNKIEFLRELKVRRDQLIQKNEIAKLKSDIKRYKRKNFEEQPGNKKRFAETQFVSPNKKNKPEKLKLYYGENIKKYTD